MQNINFKGNYLKQVNIKKLTPKGEYKTIKANFIELTHDDVSVLDNISKIWEKSGAKMTLNIKENSLLPPDILKNRMNQFLYLTKNIKKDDVLTFLSSKILGTHLYAVTKQEDEFEKLKTDDILGIVDIQVSENRSEIAQLHVRPDCISEKYGNQVFLYLKKKICDFLGIKNNKEKRPYSHIGEAIITTLQSMYNDKPIELISLNPAKGFYRKYGFYNDISSGMEYIWKSKN